MADCKECGKYTKFKGGLCLSCWKKDNKDAKPKSTKTPSKDKKSWVFGLVKNKITKSKSTKNPSKKSTWSYNLIKGRIAETLIEELFLKLNFQVFKYGMENTIPGIMELLRGVKDDVAMEIKRMPDLVVYKDKKAHFIEVKFRANESFKLYDADKKGDYPYHNAIFVIVSKKHIKCISFAELKQGKEISPKCRNYLGSRKEFETDKEKIVEFCEHAVKFFENV